METISPVKIMPVKEMTIANVLEILLDGLESPYPRVVAITNDQYKASPRAQDSAFPTI